MTPNSRAYITQFAQPDSIIPDPYNPMDWNRYAYVHYNPINFNDPDGHKACSNDGDSFDSCKDPLKKTLGEIADDYGIHFSGGSNEQHVSVVVGGIQIGNKLQEFIPNSTSASAFSSTYGNVYATFSGAGNGCDASSGIGFICGTSTWSDPRLYVHELGHTLNVKVGAGGPYDTLNNSLIIDADGNVVLQGRSMPTLGLPSNGYVRTTLGFKGDGAPDLYHGPGNWGDWNSNDLNTARNEDFADMFMNWVFGTFANNSAGDARNDWMNANMGGWLR